MSSHEISIPSIITLLFATKTDLHNKQQNQELQDSEQKLQRDISQSLEALCTWISLSKPNITISDIQENIEGICQLYPLEVHAWTQDIHAPIHLLIDRARSWINQPQSPSSSNHSAAHLRSRPLVKRNFAPALSESDADEQALLLKALADPTRLRIFSLLQNHEGDICVDEIVQQFPLEQPTISHHLRIMRMVHLIECRKQGLWAYYYLRRDTLFRLSQFLTSLLEERG